MIYFCPLPFVWSVQVPFHRYLFMFHSAMMDTAKHQSPSGYLDIFLEQNNKTTPSVSSHASAAASRLFLLQKPSLQQLSFWAESVIFLEIGDRFLIPLCWMSGKLFLCRKALDKNISTFKYLTSFLLFLDSGLYRYIKLATFCLLWQCVNRTQPNYFLAAGASLSLSAVKLINIFPKKSKYAF